MDLSRLSSSLGLVTGLGTVLLAILTAMIWLLFEWGHAKSLLCREVLWNAAFRSAIIGSIKDEGPLIEAARAASRKVTQVEIQDIANFCERLL